MSWRNASSLSNWWERLETGDGDIEHIVVQVRGLAGASARGSTIGLRRFAAADDQHRGQEYGDQSRRQEDAQRRRDESARTFTNSFSTV